MPKDTEGLTKWFKEKHRLQEKGGGYEKCGRKSAKGSKENIPNVYQLPKLHQ